jgi:hypothetical protein
MFIVYLVYEINDYDYTSCLALFTPTNSSCCSHNIIYDHVDLLYLRSFDSATAEILATGTLPKIINSMDAGCINLRQLSSSLLSEWSASKTTLEVFFKERMNIRHQPFEFDVIGPILGLTLISPDIQSHLLCYLMVVIGYFDSLTNFLSSFSSFYYILVFIEMSLN